MSNIESLWSKALLGAIGAISPDIMLLYSKRWTMSELQFDLWHYVTACILYVLLAAIVSTIYPYKGKVSAWKVFSVGVALPVIFSALVTAVPHGHDVSPRGSSVNGTLLQMLALF